MGVRIFNTLSRQVEDFTPLDPSAKEVGMYCCGPTVYDFGHIGNFRTFVFADLLRRFLEFNGYAVRHVMNITDVEDKIIRRVHDSGLGLRQYTRRYETAFLEDLQTLRCLRPHLMPRATEHIPEILQLIEQLLHQGMAYQAADGSVYFSIEKYRASGRQYGQLVALNMQEMRPGQRVQHDEYSKESIADFALWKSRSPEDGDIFWPSPWGEGRPGWHIECSAMSMKHLSPNFDLHLGGEDLVFPHHEDEIAQSEASGWQKANHRFVRYWVHGAHLLVEGRKMAKSLGNYFTLRDLLAQGYHGREVRYLLLKAHYRETFNFTLDGLEEARKALARLDACLGKLRDCAGTSSTTLNTAPGLDLLESFSAALNEDLNISAAWGAVFDWIRDTNRSLDAGAFSPQKAAAQLVAWIHVDQVLGLGQPDVDHPVPAQVMGLVRERELARKGRDFRRADELREAIKKLGWLVEDTPKGPNVKRV